MGRIEDKHKKRKSGDTESPLGHIGDRNQKTNDFDIDEKTIKDQKNKE
jgi:hypothetical protein